MDLITLIDDAKNIDFLNDENPKKLELGDKLNAKFEKASQNYSNVIEQ
ncbi:hypothetical protein [Leptotrichia sp. oral taxon 847]|nr:hypothetical protein [Leptotrichia sp. oral taxon 847]